MKLVLANADYIPEKNSGHMTDEGHQLQAGLEAAGWTLAGAGFGDGCTDVPTLLERFKPEVVFVQDKRDWDPNCGAFRKDLAFRNLGALKAKHDIVKVAVVKDAGTRSEYQREFCAEMGADAVVIYYHPKSVVKLSPWLEKYPLLRTYHTVDPSAIPDLTGPRKRAIVTGARGGVVYPLREFVINSAKRINCDVKEHPGYHNRGCQTPQYLKLLAGYKVHVATASAHAFALRKIIESVAVGTTPVTDLPDYDTLPEIDEALVRICNVRQSSTMDKVLNAAESSWNLERALDFSRKAVAFYDYRASGSRLSAVIDQVRSQVVHA